MNNRVVHFFVPMMLVLMFFHPPFCYGKNISDNRGFAIKFQQAVVSGDKSYIAHHISYPIKMYIGGNEQNIDGPELLEDAYDVLMTSYLYRLIISTPPVKLVKLLDIKKNKNGVYTVRRLLFARDPNDFRYAKVGIASAKDLMNVIDTLKQGAEENCAKCVAKVISYPDTVCLGNKWVKIRNSTEFITHYNQIVTPELKNLMENAWALGNWTGFPEKGIMLGSGQIWIQSYGHKNAQGFFVWETKVTALHELNPTNCPVESTAPATANES